MALYNSTALGWVSMVASGLLVFHACPGFLECPICTTVILCVCRRA